MKTYRSWAAISLVAGLFTAVGCGSGERYAAVSGVVMLDGKPYDSAVVVFQPMATAGNINPGMGSSAYTDANGKFVLKCVDGKNNGAIVGKHIVRIMTKGNDIVGYDPATGSPDGDPKAAAKGRVDPIPPEWNSNSTKEFEVTSSGTDKANFDITSVKKPDPKKK